MANKKSEKSSPKKASAMNLIEKLNIIQCELKAPKSQHNSFGNYDYRSCEDILGALKPFLKKYGIIITLNDEVVYLVAEESRFYIKATASIFDINSGDKISTVAYAREAKNKKGMDEAQVTGSASSYARKYALNGLFGIDDTKDSDYTNKGETSSKEVKAENLLSEKKMKEIAGILEKINNAKDQEELTALGEDIKEQKLDKSQTIVLKKAWMRKFSSLKK
jgi:hypothetical protein